jgi:circadian clock protein KaiA
MSEPALTIASLLRSAALKEACAFWLKSGRYALIPMEAEDPASTMRTNWESYDAIILEQGAFPRELFEVLREEKLLLPAVVISQQTSWSNCPTAWMLPFPAF